MTVADDLEAARASLVMINPAPYNAEAPPAALVGDVTPTEMHYVRSNFAVPDHDGTFEIGGAVGATHDPHPRRPARDAGPRPHGHPRVRRQRPPGDAAATDRRALGRLRRLHRPLDRSPAARGPGEGRAGGGRGRAPRPGRRPRRRTTFRRSCPRPTRTTSPSPVPCRWHRPPTRQSGILIAYEMNGQPLGRDHGAPFRLIVPHWYAVASVKWLKRLDVLTEPYTGEFQTGHYIYQWPDRPHEPVTLMRVRARITDPAPGSTIERELLHRPRKGLVGHRSHHPRGRQPHRRR